MPFDRMFSILEALKIPNTYWVNKSYEYKYWFRSLFSKLISTLVFKGLPDEWPKDFFRFCLWSMGSLCVFKSERFGDSETGLAFFPATVSQYDFYYQPVKALVSNPLFTKEFTIHKDCEMIKLTPDCYFFGGLIDIIDYYSSKLAELSKSIDMGIINAKFPMCAIATDQASSNQLKAIYDKIQSGESLVVWKDMNENFDEVIPQKEPFFTWQNDLKNNYIVSELLENMQTILNSFYMETGLPTILNDKKAHTLNVEADFQNAQSQARLASIMTTTKESLEYVNDMFNVNLEVEYAKREENDSLRSGAVSEQDE